MSVVTFGFGDTSARVVTLGFGVGAGAQSGSYITLGEGQSASLFLRLGLYIGEESGGSPGGSPTGSPTDPTPPEVVTVSGGAYQFYFPPSNRERIRRDDDEIIALIMSMIQTGIIH